MSWSECNVDAVQNTSHSLSAYIYINTFACAHLKYADYVYCMWVDNALHTNIHSQAHVMLSGFTYYASYSAN